MSKWHITFDDNGEGLAVKDIAELEGLCTSLGFSATISSTNPVSKVLEQVVAKMKESIYSAPGGLAIINAYAALEAVRSFMPPAEGSAG